MNARRLGLGLCVAAATVWSATSHGVELSAENKEKLVWLDQSLQKVVTLYREHKTEELKALVDEIDGAITGLQIANESDTVIEPVLAPFRLRLAAARKLVERAPLQTASAAPVKGSAMPAAKPMPTAMASGTVPRPRATASATRRPRPGQAMAGVSFVNDVAPIFVAKCGNCHIRGNRGDFSMATFAELAAGTGGTLAVIKPGQGATSTIVEKMASGEMPPGGNKVTADELATITKWIDQGAKFDGPDMRMSLNSFAPGAAGTGQVARATGNESVHFMRDVAPILMDNCFECHGADRPNDNSDNFGMFRFSDLMRGGQSGPVVVPGNPNGSILVQMLKGTAKGAQGEMRPQMPRRAPPLDDADMAKITTWIAEGAKFDGENPEQSISLAVRMAIAKKATHEELMQSRAATAKKNWSTANPDSPSETLETTDFLLIGDVGPVRMEETKKVLEAERAKIATALKLPAGKPMVKGRITVYVFDKAFEHKEFARVVEQREIASGVNSHWTYNYIDAYACVVATPGAAEEFAPLLAETVIGCYFDSVAEGLPRWFAVGTARNMAAKMHPQNPIVKSWEDGAVSSGVTPQTLVNSRNLDAGMGAVSQAFVKDLMRSPKWTSLMNGLASGARFDGAFAQAFGGPPLPLLTQWVSRR